MKLNNKNPANDMPIINKRFLSAFYPLFATSLFAVSLLIGPALPAAAQLDTDKSQQAFDYNPDASETPQIEQETISVDYGDSYLVTNDPLRGVYRLSRSRWKNWVERAVYLLIMDIALLVVLLSLPKSDEHNIIIAYVLSGASSILSFWVFLCAMLLFQMRPAAGFMILPLSLVMAAVSYIILMKIKRSDVSLSELKESFQKMSALSNEDSRLASMEGQPGDWPDKDFIK